MSGTFLRLNIVFLIAALTVSCATTIQGTQQSIAFEFVQSSGNCDVEQEVDGKKIVEKIDSQKSILRVQKSRNPLTLTCFLSGRRAIAAQIISRMSAPSFAGLAGVALLSPAAGISTAVDASSGAMFIYPDKVSIDLVKNEVRVPESWEVRML